MSLKAWFPLNNDTLDYSGNNLKLDSYSGSFDNNGKIGKAFLANGTTDYLRIPSFYTNTKNLFTICFWIYPIGASGWIISPSSAGMDHRLAYASNTISVGLVDGPDLNSYGLSSTSNTVPLNKWTHVTVSINDSEVKIYINGVLNNSGTSTLSTNVAWTGFWDILKRGTNTYYQNAKLNDFRIYDHILSVKEIKDIYKTKILHYNFNDLQEPTENLAIKPITYYAPYYSMVRDGQKLTFTATSTPYAIVIDIPDLGSLQGRTFAYSGYMKKNGVPWIYQTEKINSYNASTSSKLKYFDPVTGYFEVVEYFDSTNSWIMHAVVTGGTVVAGDVITIEDFQMEEKDHVTRFINGSRTGIVKDISGYKNNATLNSLTTPQWINSSILGNGCYKFNPLLNNNICIPNSACKVTDSISVSTWAYRANWNQATGERIISCTEGGGWQIGFNDSVGYLSAALYCNGSYASPGILLSTITSGWHHIVFTFDGRYQKLYLDGILKSTIDRTATYPIVYNPTNGIFIGAEPATSNTTPAGQYWDGMIDDVRIYATALTDQDILDMYKSKASISKDSKFYVNEISEVSNWCEYAKGINLITNGAVELNDTTNIGTGATVITTDGVSNGKCFERTGPLSIFLTDYIPVNTSDSYELGGYFKSTGIGGSSRLYYGIACYDKDKAYIEHLQCNYYSNTKTTLAQPLNNGNTVVYLTSTANWQIGTQGSTASNKYIGIFDRDGYPDYGRSKNHRSYINVDTTANTITLSSAWNGTTIPAGTKVANNLDSGYNYIAAVNDLIPALWTSYKGTVTSEIPNGGYGKSFRSGTKYVKIVLLLNYSQTTDYTTRFTDLYFRNTSRHQPNLNQIGFNVSKKSILNTKEINEFAPLQLNRKGVHNVLLGNEVLPVYVDDSNGGKWIRVFYHNCLRGTVLFSDANSWAEVKETNKTSPMDVNKYSILSKLESLRRKDGKFEFMLKYPTDSPTGKNIWYQTSNPTSGTAGVITGYEAQSISWTANFWGGLALSDRIETLIDGSPTDNTWYYSIGAKVKNGTGIPSYGTTADEVELYVRTDKELFGTTTDRFYIDKQGNAYSREFIEI